MTDPLLAASSGVRNAQGAMGNVAFDVAASEANGSTTTDSVFVVSPNGVNMKTVYNYGDRGGHRYTDRDLDLAVSGKGMYLVKGADGLVSLKKTCSLNIGEGGTLVDDEGNEILAWPTTADGEIDPDKVTNRTQTSQLVTINVNTVTLSASATTTASLGVNLPALQKNGDDLPGGTAADDNGHKEVTPIEVYDSLGTSQTVNVKWRKLDADGTTNPPIPASTWEVRVDSDKATGITQGDGGQDYRLRVTFDANGKITNRQVFLGDGADPNYADVPADQDLPNIYIQWDQTNTAIAPSDIQFDLSRITQIGHSYTSSNNKVDGLPVGTVDGISFNDIGVGRLRFSNGSEMAIAKLPLGAVAAERSMRQGSDNRYFSTAESGEIVISEAKSGGYGSIAPKNLEGSAIDTSERLTLLIKYNHYYGSNVASYGINRNAGERFLSAVGG